MPQDGRESLKAAVTMTCFAELPLTTLKVVTESPEATRGEESVHIVHIDPRGPGMLQETNPLR